jgi:LysR family transcriptional regulator, glycine cleavage system transcriptional activator
VAHRKLAHLTALRAFEAVARHMSFARAARELSVTPGAISQQIRTLEDYYEVKLFRRHNRRISLTDEAQAVMPDLRAAFDRLSTVAARLQEQSAGGLITVSAPPTLAAKWLVQRLGGFAKAHPKIQVSLESTDRLVDLLREDVDLTLRYGRGKWPGLRAEWLVDEWISPACSPDYLRKAQIHAPSDLAGANLIHDRTMLSDPLFPSWKSWFTAAKVDAGGEQGALHFSSSITAIQAAVDGQGVVLGRSVAIDEELRSGRLVLPFPDIRVPGYGYYVVYRQDALDSQKVAAFKDWLVETFDAHAGAEAGHPGAIGKLT